MRHEKCKDVFVYTLLFLYTQSDKHAFLGASIQCCAEKIAFHRIIRLIAKIGIKPVIGSIFGNLSTIKKAKDCCERQNLHHNDYVSSSLCVLCVLFLISNFILVLEMSKHKRLNSEGDRQCSNCEIL